MPPKKDEAAEAVAEQQPAAPAKPGLRCFRNAGQIYYGNTRTGANGECIRHGHGHQIFTAQTVAGESIKLGQYEGFWRDDRMTGTGSYEWSDGSRYVGDFVDGVMHGCGKFTWPEGSAYDGMWSRNEMDGQGRFHSCFIGESMEGAFYRNCFRQHDGKWIDIFRQREKHRQDRLRIAAEPGAQTPVLRCTPADLDAKIASVIQQDNRVPLVVSDASCPELEGSRSAAPLSYLEQGDRGCTEETTIHITYAALVRRRQHDHNRLFREAVREALLKYRLFAVVFGDNAGNPQADGIDRLPEEWQLEHFFDRFSLPPELFDTRHFHGAGLAEHFIPEDRRGSLGPQTPTLPGSASAEIPAEEPSQSRPASAEAEGEAPDQAALTLEPPTAFLLRFVLVWLGYIEANSSDEEVRKRVERNFAQHVPLHRVTVVVVSA